jgi:hypothetical protein
MIGRTADAERLFERLAGLCNDVGLIAEEYDVGAQRLLGNFPQAFSHIALINTAYNLDHAAKPCEQRSGHKRIGARSKRPRLVREPAELSMGMGTRARRTRSAK